MERLQSRIRRIEAVFDRGKPRSRPQPQPFSQATSPAKSAASEVSFCLPSSIHIPDEQNGGRDPDSSSSKSARRPGCIVKNLASAKASPQEEPELTRRVRFGDEKNVVVEVQNYIGDCECQLDEAHSELFARAAAILRVDEKISMGKYEALIEKTIGDLVVKQERGTDPSEVVAELVRLHRANGALQDEIEALKQWDLSPNASQISPVSETTPEKKNDDLWLQDWSLVDEVQTKIVEGTAGPRDVARFESVFLTKLDSAAAARNEVRPVIADSMEIVSETPHGPPARKVLVRISESTVVCTEGIGSRPDEAEEAGEVRRFGLQERESCVDKVCPIKAGGTRQGRLAAAAGSHVFPAGYS